MGGQVCSETAWRNATPLFNTHTHTHTHTHCTATRSPVSWGGLVLLPLKFLSFFKCAPVQACARKNSERIQTYTQQTVPVSENWKKKKKEACLHRPKTTCVSKKKKHKSHCTHFGYIFSRSGRIRSLSRYTLMGLCAPGKDFQHGAKTAVICSSYQDEQMDSGKSEGRLQRSERWEICPRFVNSRLTVPPK